MCDSCEVVRPQQVHGLQAHFQHTGTEKWVVGQFKRQSVLEGNWVLKVPFSRGVSTCQREYVTIIQIWEPEVLMHCLDRSTQEARQAELCELRPAWLISPVPSYLSLSSQGQS